MYCYESYDAREYPTATRIRQEMMECYNLSESVRSVKCISIKIGFKMKRGGNVYLKDSILVWVIFLHKMYNIKI